jgi:hypothetical protein
MTTTLMDYLPIEQRDTEPLPAIAISEQDTMRVPATLPIARPVRPMLATWLYERCSEHGGACDGTLDVLQHESGIPFSLEDIRTLARYGYIGKPLICEDGGCEPYVFVVWESRV